MQSVLLFSEVCGCYTYPYELTCPQHTHNVGIGVTLNSLGKVYHELGYLTQSQLAFLRSQSIGEKLYHNNPDHPQVLIAEQLS